MSRLRFGMPYLSVANTSLETFFIAPRAGWAMTDSLTRVCFTTRAREIAPAVERPDLVGHLGQLQEIGLKRGHKFYFQFCSCGFYALICPCRFHRACSSDGGEIGGRGEFCTLKDGYSA